MTRTAPAPSGPHLRLALLALTGALALVSPACHRHEGPPVLAGAAVGSVEPASQYPGQKVTLQGSGFTGATQVAFGGIQALDPRVDSDTRITVTVPAGAVSGKVTVLTPRGTAVSATDFTVLALPAAPAVASFAPVQGQAGQEVTLAGTGFTGATAVRFAGVPAATVQVLDDARITATVPQAANTGLITVVTPAGQAASNGDFKVLPSLAPLTVTSGAPLAAVVLTGSGFTGATAVRFGALDAQSFTVASANRIDAQAPATAVSGPITVATPWGVASSAPQAFTVQAPAPVVTGLAPASGPEGQEVVISGSNLGLATGVTFGGTPAAAITVAPDGLTLTTRVPPAALSGPVLVLAAAGNLTVPGGGFTVTSPVLSAQGFTPSGAPVFGAVVITGAHLDQATSVTFGGVPALGLEVAPDGLSLTVTVPRGAVTGPVRVHTLGGPVPVPGGDFTVQAVAPHLSEFAPTEGVPGTEVTLTGAHLGGVTRVSYGGLALEAARYDLDSDTRIRVRVPDDAQTGASFQVDTGAGVDQTAAFTLLPSRRAALPLELAKFVNPVFGKTWANYPGAGRSALYGNLMQTPFAPVFHPYNPTGFVDETHLGNRPDHLLPRYSVSLKLPAPFFPFLPASVQARATTQGLDPASVDLLCASQDYTFDGTSGVGGIYLFRPHYWTDPLAPATGIYYVGHNLSAGLFETDPGVTLSGQPAGSWLTFGILTHGPGPATAGDILASGYSEPMAGFDLTRSTGLWTLTQEGSRAAATLHLLFNDDDQTALDDLVQSAGTLQDLLLALGRSPMGGTRGVQMLLALARPAVTAVQADPQEATLTGTCFTGATEVRLNGAAIPGWRVVSDAVLKVPLPAGATGSVQVVTPMGASDPFPLP